MLTSTNTRQLLGWASKLELWRLHRAERCLCSAIEGLAAPVSEQPGECLLDDELFDRLASVVGNRPIDPPQCERSRCVLGAIAGGARENIDELCEWLGDANSQQAETMRCWNYLGNKERRLVERCALIR